MSTTMPRDSTTDTFMNLFNGVLKGMLEWSQWDALVAALKARNDGGWYVYYVGEEAPTHPAHPTRFQTFLEEITTLLRRDHDESYLGIVYVDDFELPRFIKIYDPHHLGSSCGSSRVPILPGWVLSRVPPADLHAKVANPAGRRRWWKKLFP